MCLLARGKKKLRRSAELSGVSSRVCVTLQNTPSAPRRARIAFIILRRRSLERWAVTSPLFLFFFFFFFSVNFFPSSTPSSFVKGQTLSVGCQLSLRLL